MKYIFGVDLGGTTVKMGLFNESGEVLEKWEIKTVKDNNGAILRQASTPRLQRKIWLKRM